MVATPLPRPNSMTHPARTGSVRAIASSTRSAAAPASTAKPRTKRSVTPTPVAPSATVPLARSEPPRPSAPPMSSRHQPRSAMPGGYVAPPLPNTPAPDFRVGDKAVHPAHGVGEVTAIEQREIGGTRTTFYILRILDNAMKVLVPTSAATQVGLRGIMSDVEANNILTTMRAREVAVDVQPWSRRFRVYTEMIKSGSATEIAKVLRDMNRLKFDKELSFGERRLLDQARSLLLKELAFAKKTTESEMAEQIKRIFSA